MPLANEFALQLTKLRDLDHKIIQILQSEEQIAEEIGQLVDTREQILQSLLEMINLHPQLAKQQNWQTAIAETKTVVQQMQLKTTEISQAMQKYRHGKRSVQQYQKFL